MDSELRYVAQLTFTHDPLIGLVDAFHLILKFAVTFWQFFSDDVCASWNVQARGGSKKQQSDRSGTYKSAWSSFKLVRYRA